VIPDLVDGLLPEGIHPTTMEAVRVAFGASNPRRIELMEKLTDLATFAASFGIFAYLYIDGSFCTDKALPDDVDVVLELRERPGLASLLAHPEKRKLLDRKATKAHWRADVFVQPPPPATPDMVTFFTHLRQEEILRRKLKPERERGIVRVAL
jgi:hypothetical protein